MTNSLDRKKQQAYLEKLSYRDMLTGLYNRNRYIERLEAYKQVQDQQIGAIYIDLNGLKKVNDEQGHRAGASTMTIGKDKVEKYRQTILGRTYKSTERIEVSGK